MQQLGNKEMNPDKFAKPNGQCAQIQYIVIPVSTVFKPPSRINCNTHFNICGYIYTQSTLKTYKLYTYK